MPPPSLPVRNHGYEGVECSGIAAGQSVRDLIGFASQIAPSLFTGLGFSRAYPRQMCQYFSPPTRVSPTLPLSRERAVN
jgi:hypothetical protein